MNATSTESRGPFSGLRENIGHDALSGFMVFLLALPLSMGIATASDFPPIYGLITAMVGGVVVTFFAGSELTIKGPAAGLIVIVAGAVSEFGGGTQGWHFALGAIVVAGVVQMLFGLLKAGSLSDFFPLSAVHGMLAAIGIIIISKQFHGVLGLNPVHGWLHQGLPSEAAAHPLVEPFDLLHAIPYSVSNFDQKALFVGLMALLIVFGWPAIKNKFTRRIPAPLVVLLVTIPLSFLLELDSKLFIHFDKGLIDTFQPQVSFGGWAQAGVFIKYVVMFALVGSLEALLTVKAIDMLDPQKRKANANRDLTSVGMGNVISGIFGGLPMISEVARSSANIHNGGRTRWANFFHGGCMLVFLLFATTFSDLIPKPALAALLMGVGYRLAHPREFAHMWHIGREQFVIFIGTVVITLATDLLVGIFAGILIKFLFEWSFGVKPKEIFKADVMVVDKGDGIELNTTSSLIFSNYLSLSKLLRHLPQGQHVVLNVDKSTVVDHSALENLHHFMEDYNRKGGKFELIGLENHRPLSRHSHAVHVKTKIKLV
jgi:MFS superfamily sulfate permease-like transporter